MPRTRSEHEQQFIANQTGQYACWCGYSYTGPLEVWLPLRDLHWADAHPGFTPRKRRRHSIPGLNRNQSAYEEEARV